MSEAAYRRNRDKPWSSMCKDENHSVCRGYRVPKRGSREYWPCECACHDGAERGPLPHTRPILPKPTLPAPPREVVECRSRPAPEVRVCLTAEPRGDCVLYINDKPVVLGNANELRLRVQRFRERGWLVRWVPLASGVDDKNRADVA